MATWKNLDTLASYSKLAGLKGHVNIAEAMTGENGAERVRSTAHQWQPAWLITMPQNRLTKQS